MDLNANVKLSKEEWELVQNREWILTKHAVIGKVVTMFGRLSDEYRRMIQNDGLNEFLIPEPKISKGEQYEQLPYVMLDFPRIFDKEHTFAIRCFFWWGNFFSINLHVSGKYQEKYFASLQQLQKSDDWHFCVNEDPWRHDFSEDNFRLLSSDELQQQTDRSFIKAAKKIPLSEWNRVESFYIENFKAILRSLIS